MSGIQYYWTITFGLIVGLILAVIIGFADGIQTGDPLIAVPVAVAFLYATVTTFVVLLEIAERFGPGAAVLAAIVAPTILVYWIMRIDGIPSERGLTTSVGAASSRDPGGPVTDRPIGQSR